MHCVFILSLTIRLIFARRPKANYEFASMLISSLTCIYFRDDQKLI